MLSTIGFGRYLSRMVLIVPRTYLVSIKGEVSGQPNVNVIGLRDIGNDAGGFFAAEGVALAVRDILRKAGGLMSVKSNQFVGRTVNAMDLSSAEGTVGEVAWSSVGTVAEQVSTTAAAALVKYGGGTRSRSSKGRLYWGPLTEGQINTDGRTISGAYITSLTNAMNTFKNDLRAQGLEWVVVSRKTQTARAIDSITVATIAATQRRRLR